MPRRLAAAVLCLVSAFVLSGCQFLYGLGYPYPYPSEPSPGPSIKYTTGRATITIDKGSAIELATLTEGGSFVPEYGVAATYRNEDGWYLRIMGATKGASTFASPTFMTLDRIANGEHWSAMDPGRCKFTITKADGTGLDGSASCAGLRWTDALRTGIGADYEPPYIDQPAFDAEITFEATPSSTKSG